jgi:hypothetical protein
LTPPVLLGPPAVRPDGEIVPTGDAAHQGVVNHHAETITKTVYAIMPLSKPL